MREKIEAAPLSLEEIIDIAFQVAEGLREAHHKTIVHRDIKSVNIMVTGKGRVKIMDFGPAKLAGGTKLTKTGTTLGTVAYMSPEQTLGEKVDHRTDIWSLGVILYEIMTGRLPFKGDYDKAFEGAKVFFTAMGFAPIIKVMDQGYETGGYFEAMRNAAEAMELISQDHYIQPFWLAILYAVAWEKEKCLYWMEKGYETKRSAACLYNGIGVKKFDP